MELKIKDVVLKSNVRKDLGDIDELAASIKEKGVLQPLLVTSKNVLVAGYRRLKAAEAVGLKVVPVFVVDALKEGFEEVQLTENIQRKDLDAVEEADAFQAYMDASGHGVDYLAKKIGKSDDYVQRRVILQKLSPESKKAVLQKKIRIGHAVILARYDKKKQAVMLKEIISDNQSVGDLISELDSDDDNAKSLSNGIFDKASGLNGDGIGKTGCKGCVYNGGEQALLIDVEDYSIKDLCMKPACFLKKTDECLKKEVESLKKKGVNVLSEEELEALPFKREIHSWDGDYVPKTFEKHPEKYAVLVKVGYEGFENDYFLIVRPVEKKQDAVSVESKVDKIKEKVDEYKTSFLKDKCCSLLKSGKDLKALLVYSLIVDNQYEDEVEDACNALGIKDKLHIEEKGIFKVFSADEKVLDSALVTLAKISVSRMSNNPLEFVAKVFGMDYKNDFVWTKDFLNLFSIAQLKELAVEVEVNTAGFDKKTDLINAFLKADLKGKVPKIIVGGLK